MNEWFFLTFLILPITCRIQVNIYNKIVVFYFSSTLVSLVQKIIQDLLLKTIIYFVTLSFEVVTDVFYQHTKKFARIIFTFKTASRVNDRMIKTFYFEIIIWTVHLILNRPAGSSRTQCPGAGLGMILPSTALPLRLLKPHCCWLAPLPSFSSHPHPNPPLPPMDGQRGDLEA